LATEESDRLRVPESPTWKNIRMNWARRLRWVFGIEIEQCVRCGGRLAAIASIEEPELIERILAQRHEHADGLARATGATAAVAVVIRQIVDGLVLCGAGDGQRCAQCDRRPTSAARTR